MSTDAYHVDRASNYLENSNNFIAIMFFTVGISSVMHPKNPFAPTMHFNFRYFETHAPKVVDGVPTKWFYNGGID